MLTHLFRNGQPAGAEELAGALVNYGHFTTLQVVGGQVLGLDLHLQRLDEGNRGLFGTELPPERVRAEVRAALKAMGGEDAALRITVYSPQFDVRDPLRPVPVQLLVSLSPPMQASRTPLRVGSCHYLRQAPEFKHVGTFGLFHQRRLARAAGFDDALFVDPQGRVVEGSVWNLGLWDGQAVTWPQGPALRGTRERLLQQGLAILGVVQHVRPVGLQELPSFQAAFACNARGQQPIAVVDDTAFGPAEDLLQLLERALATQPWQRL